MTVLKNGNVGIGPVNPSAKLEVGGQIKITGGSPGDGKVLTSDAAGLASWQITTGGGFTLPYSGTASYASDPIFNITNTGSGNGIKGKSAATSGVYYGVMGESSSVNGSGIYGSSPNIGVEAHGYAPTGTAIWGYAYDSEGTNYAIRAQTNSSNGYSGFFNGGRFHISGNTGIGVLNPTAKLEVAGQMKITGGNPGTGKVLTSDAAGLASWQAASGGLSLPYSGDCSSANAAFSINQSGTGQAIYVYNPAETGEVTSVSAHNNSSSGTGIGAYMHATSGTATGISGFSASSAGTGVKGIANSGTGVNYGVKGESKSIEGIGVWGTNTSTTGTTYGVGGSVSSPTGYSGYFIGGRFVVMGNVGIGTSSPAAKLEISASQGPNLIIRDSNGGADRPGIQFTNNNIHFIGGDDGSEEVFGFYSGYGNNRNYAARLNIHGPAISSWGYYLGFTHDGKHGRINTDNGHLILEPAGKSVGINTEDPTQSLDVNGNARFRAIGSGAYAGVVNRMGDGTLTTATSDERLKENIHSLQNSLDKVMQLRGVTFTWKTNPEYGPRIGFIAQEFEKVIPELVFTNEVDGYKGINYAEVSAVLVEALKEQQNIMEELEAENGRLKTAMDHMKADFETRISKLEKLITVFAEK